MSPLTLFLQADIVVKVVMVGLLLASIWTWGIIFTHSARLTRARVKARRTAEAFWKAKDIDGFVDAHRADGNATARILRAGVEEYHRSTRAGLADRAAARDRIAVAAEDAMAGELEKLSDRLNILATIGSVAPFVGLFGTVWGIMRSFTAIAGANNTSLAVVAPGIAEALFATAIGLFAAIPAVIAYNRLTHRLDAFENELTRFSDRFQATLSRQLERA
ncbi:protein TolQ [Sphingomicrobium astaxanthinifaciens]|uniref:protein TolQ n=1 Tax=Sphingomicrobium astaxanthinifaciens TaxID=1227949 RepID=UPI001FCB4276|nr:protein TolQ [Sphingomicrobium astaxanthinifaciens]MCJ7420895.1 protein TolQ [Sphingomicrobium astaxanthinifaciens]